MPYCTPHNILPTIVISSPEVPSYAYCMHITNRSGTGRYSLKTMLGAKDDQMLSPLIPSTKCYETHCISDGSQLIFTCRCLHSSVSSFGLY